MILVCPNCSTRYLLSSAAIGAEGRDVRCAKCAHEWFQEGDSEFFENQPFDDNTDYEDDDRGSESQDDDPFGDYQDQEEDNDWDGEAIPESVRPLPEKSNVPAFAKDVLRKPASLQARIMGYGAALLIFMGLIVVSFIFKTQIVSAWPPSAIIYELAGSPLSLKGEKLVMESLSATIFKGEDDKDVLVLKGRVINLTDKPVNVPQMRAVLRSTNGEDGDSWIIDAPVDEVESGASFAFTSDYPNVPGGVGSVNLTFVPTINKS